MLYRIGSQKLTVPEVGKKHRTPRQTVPWRDVAEAARCLDAVCAHVPTPKRVVDGIAKVGFWGSVFLNRWPGCSLHLNDVDEGCVSILQDNFPGVKITSYDAQVWAPKACDVGLLDADHFTLRILDQWQEALERWDAACKYLIVADGACFGFKFGNLSHYGVNREQDYYKLLDKALRKFLNKRITVVSKFMNAANLLLEEKPGEGIVYVPPSDLLMSRGGVVYKQPSVKGMSGGLGFC